MKKFFAISLVALTTSLCLAQQKQILLPQISYDCPSSFKPTEQIEIWNGVKMPGETTESLDYSKRKHKPQRMNVKYATLSFYKAPNAKKEGCVIICPGGGYNNLWSVKSEGIIIAKFLNERGISAAVLEYRVPNNFEGALMDAQRAIRLVKANARKWNIANDKIAIMGFSAGASLAARASTNFKNPSYGALDENDKIEPRPNYTILIYPAYCSQPEMDRRLLKDKYKAPSEDYSQRYQIASWNEVDASTPPAFITQTQFDPYVDASIAYYLSLKKHKIPAELVMFSEGHHGYKSAFAFELLAKILKKRGY